MSNLVITTRPITDEHTGYLLLCDENGLLKKFFLEQNEPLNIKILDANTRYCTGWYDIMARVNHPCAQNRTVDTKYDQCMECRNKTGFNPAFYNTTNISDAQAELNNTPHSVYIAYFGSGLVKAGMMSDARGLDRIYEQGALMYTVVDSYENATKAHNAEAKFISRGAANSISKRQKEKVLASSFDAGAEMAEFIRILAELGLSDKKAVSNINHFFYGTRPAEVIKPLGENPISGAVCGVIGRYLVLNNNDNLYGFWLSSLHGYKIKISQDIIDIEPEPQQISLF